MSNRALSGGPSDRPALIWTFILVVAVPFILIVIGRAHLTPFFLGGAAWVIAVILKAMIALFFRYIVDVRRQRIVAAMVYGFLSAATELGTAGLCFIYLLPPLSWAEVLVFGVGAFSTEVLFVIPTAIVHRWLKPDPTLVSKWQERARQSWWVCYGPLIERTAALFGHIGGRALIYGALIQDAWFLAFPAILGFGAVEGVAAYGHFAEWDWFATTVLQRYYAFSLCVGAVNTALYMLLGV